MLAWLLAGLATGIAFTATWDVCVGADCDVQDDAYRIYAGLVMIGAAVVLVGGLILAFRVNRQK